MKTAPEYAALAEHCIDDARQHAITYQDSERYTSWAHVYAILAVASALHHREGESK